MLSIENMITIRQLMTDFRTSLPGNGVWDRWEAGLVVARYLEKLE
jgi:hypothetical protein